MPSSSRPGQFSYVNIHTDEKIAWLPTEPASRTPGRVPPPPGRGRGHIAETAEDEDSSGGEEEDDDEGEGAAAPVEESESTSQPVHIPQLARGAPPGGFPL